MQRALKIWTGIGTYGLAAAGAIAVGSSEAHSTAAEEYTDEQVAQMRAGIMPLLTAAPPTSTNTVVVGHDDVFESATGIYPEPQGIGFVLTPDGQGGFVIQASLAPEDWVDLLE